MLRITVYGIRSNFCVGGGGGCKANQKCYSGGFLFSEQQQHAIAVSCDGVHVCACPGWRKLSTGESTVEEVKAPCEGLR